MGGRPAFAGPEQVDQPGRFGVGVGTSQRLDPHLATQRDGALPLQYLFSGTIFVKTDRGFSVQQVPWDCEYRFDMPVAVWRDLIAQHYPNTGWVRLSHETIAALAAYKSARGLLDLDHAVTSLLDSDRETAR